MKINNYINQSGALIYNEDAEFEIHSEDGSVCLLTKILNHLHKNDALVRVVIVKNGKLLFDEDGGLVKKKDQDGVEGYFICGANLDYLLFYNTDEHIDITIRSRLK